MNRSVRRIIGAVAAAALTVAACSGGGGPTEHGRVAVTRRVPSRYRTIQAAVDAAQRGDVVEIAAGLYREAVVVETDGVTLRGDRRDGVIIDGEGRRANGISVYARGVSVERLTVRNHRVNGVLVAGDYGTGATPRADYRVSEVTATDNGLYGLYAFGVRGGVIERSEATGSPDSGIYIGQCNPCDAIVRDNVATGNRVGYEATNASGVRVERNQWSRNRIGMNAGSGNQERLAPQAASTIVDNVVADNDSVGIVIGGGRDNVVRDNRVSGHPDGGIVVVDQDGYVPQKNRVTANTLDNPGPDLVLAAIGAPFAIGGNCFDANSGVTETIPPRLEAVAPCGGAESTAQVPSWSPPPLGGS